MLERSRSTLVERLVRDLGWTILAALLLSLLAGAFADHRADWPDLLAGEATCLMQAASLVHDRDLVYARADFDRLLLARGGDPQDLALASGSGGRRIAFDRPFPYALWLAPFLAAWPGQGFAIANAVLLMLVSLAAARTLERRAGAWGPILVVVLVFASVVFVYTSLATGDLFHFAVTLLAFCWIAGGTGSTAGFSRWRWLAAGALLAIPLAADPLYGLLLLAAVFVPRGEHRAQARGLLLAGAAAMLVAVALAQWGAGGGLHFFATSRFRFTAATGYPLVDFPGEDWPQAIRRLSAVGGAGGARALWGPRLWLWDLVYLVAGRHIGLLPYFPTLVLLILGGSLRRGRRAIAAAAVLWGIAVILSRPFDLHGGEAVANRLFLPVYGALPLVLDRRRRWLGRPTLAALAVGATLVVAAPFLWRLWADARSHPMVEGRGYRHPTALARAILPYETSQRWLVGGREAEHGGLGVRFLSDGAWAESRRGRLMLAGAAELMIASDEPLAAVRLELGAGAPGPLEVRGGEIGERELLDGGGAAFRVRPRGLRRRHRLGRDPRPRYLYLLTVELPSAREGPVALRLAGERAVE